MKARLTLIAIAVLFLVCQAIAVDVTFDGSRPNNSESIVKRLKSESNPSFTLLDSLSEALMRNAYLDAAIMIRDGKLFVSAGPRYMLSKLIFVEDSTFELAVNLPFDSVNTSFAVETILELYRDLGYLYAVGESESVSVDDSSVTLTVRINKGPQVKYGRPLIAGLTRTDGKLVERYLPENPNDVLTSEYIKSVNQAAKQVPFVRLAEPATIQPRSGYTVSDLVLRFIEQTPVRFDGAAGFSGGEDNQLVWNFNLSLNNLFGQGKQVKLRSERPDNNRSLLNVGYSQPLLILGLGELNLNVRTRDYREQFYEFSLGAGYKTRLNREFVTGLSFEWKSTKPEISNLSYNRYVGQFSVSRKTFNEDFNPKIGMALAWSIDFSFRKYTAPELPPQLLSRSYNETRNTLNTEFYRPIIGSFQLYSSLNYIGLETGEALPPLSELILVGGPGTIRGYRDEQFAAVRTAFGTFEPRFRFSQAYISIFYDAAYLNNRVNDYSNTIVTDEDYKWSYGLGFGLGNSNRNVSLSLGVNPEQGIGEPRLSIKLSSDI